MDHLSLRPAAVGDAVTAYAVTADRLTAESGRLSAVLAPLFGAADPAVTQSIHAVAAAFREAFDVVTEGHLHAGAALDTATSTVVGLDRAQADHW